MAELVDAPDSKSGDGDIVRVRFSPSVQWILDPGGLGISMHVYGAAPIGRRLMALLYDGLLWAAFLWTGLLAGQWGISHWELPQTLLGLGVLPALLLTAGLYYVYAWVHGGQTLGARAWGLVVLERSDGKTRYLSVRAALVRFVIALLGFLSGLNGIWWMLSSEWFVQDSLASSRVYWRKPAPKSPVSV